MASRADSAPIWDLDVLIAVQDQHRDCSSWALRQSWVRSRIARVRGHRSSDDSNCGNLIGKLDTDSMSHEPACRNAGNISATDGNLQIGLQFCNQLAQETDIIGKAVVIEGPLQLRLILNQPLGKRDREPRGV